MDSTRLLGNACGYNCLGVNYMLLASPPSDAGVVQGTLRDSALATEYLNKATQCHARHLEIGPDAGGRFVANTNLGLCLCMLGDVSSSAKKHQVGSWFVC